MVIFLWALAALLMLVSYQKDKKVTIKAFYKTIESINNLLPSLLTMIAIVGVTLTLFPESVLVGIFNVEGSMGVILASIIGAIVSIPGPIAFPMAGTLLKMGVRVDVLAAFVTTLTMVGVVTAPIEAALFGTRFTFMRQSLSFLSAIAIGLIMGSIL